MAPVALWSRCVNRIPALADEQSGLTEEELVMADHFGDTVQPFTMK